MVRLRVGFLVIAMMVSVFAARLFQLQGLDARAYAEKAREVGAVKEILPATRGRITDRDGRPLAESLDGLMIVADPTKTADDAGAIARILADRLGIDYFQALTDLRAAGTEDDPNHFRYVARRVPSTRARAVVEELDRLGYKGIDVRRDPVRTYPAGDVAANLVGFLNDNGDGAEGAEQYFDRFLSGKDGTATYDVGGGNRIPLGDNNVVDPVDGDDLRLTLDRDVQFYVQRVLRNTVEDAAGASGSAVVMDSRTGELLAVADYPTYDPDHVDQSARADRGTRAVRDAYEPGSVQKVLTAAALLDQKLVTPRTRIVIPSTLPSSDRVIHDYFDHGRLRLTLAGVLARSSNIGTVLAARQLPGERLYDYLRAFGLGARTGIGVDAESAGVLPDWRGWAEINKDNIAFGQGVAVSAVQMTAAVNTIANRGVYVQPSLVDGAARTNAGEEVGSATAERRRVVSATAAAQTTRIMELVTDPDRGTAPAAAVEGYRVAGKTGTAQRVGERCGCYDGTFTVSFAGFAPADQPRFTVYVVVHDPRNGGRGGSVGGPAFHKIMTYLLQQYAVPPTGSPAATLPLE
jgi:cell division protein FtsI (penicillin-binding protein 3)